MIEYCAARFGQLSIWAKCFWVVYFVTVCLPLHASNNFLSWVSIRGTYTYMHVMLLLLLMFACARRYWNARLTLANVLCTTFIFLQVIAFVMSTAGAHDVLWDFGRYVLAILFLILARTRRFGKVDLRFFLYISLLATFVNCCINLLMDVTQWNVWGLLYFNFDNRTGGGYYNLLVFLIPFALYSLLDERGGVRLPFFLAFSAIAFACMLYAKSRSVMLLTVIGCAVVVLDIMFNVHSKTFGLHLLEGLFIIALAIVGIHAFLNSDYDIARHITTATGSLTDNSDTLFTRILTAQYYMRQMLENPLGKGFGAQMMKFYDAGVWDYASVADEIDNAPVTFGYHVGIIALAVYIILLLSPFVGIARAKGAGKDLKVVLAACYALILVATAILTSQCIHSYSIVAFIWSFIGLTLDETPLSLINEAALDDTEESRLKNRGRFLATKESDVYRYHGVVANGTSLHTTSNCVAGGIRTVL